MLRNNIDQMQDILTHVLLALNRTIQHWRKQPRLYENGRRRSRNGRYSLKTIGKSLYFPRVLQLARNLLIIGRVSSRHSIECLFLKALHGNLIYKLCLHFSSLIFINIFLCNCETGIRDQRFVVLHLSIN